jgi:HSP20 family protein
MDRYYPFGEVDRLHRMMNDLFAGVTGAPEYFAAKVFPPINVRSVGSDIIVTAELPGVDPASIEATVTGATLALKGERKAEPGLSDERYQRRECRVGAFSRTVELPEQVAGDKAEARYADGVLTVRIPKLPDAQPKRIQVQMS